MNDIQKRVIDQFCEQVIARNARISPKPVEIKHKEIADHGSLVFLILEVGMVGDETTLASLLCRDRRHILIKRKGGVTLLNAKRARGTGTRSIRGFARATYYPTC